MTIDKMWGSGEHANSFSSDPMKSNVRIVVYASEERAAVAIEAVQACALEERTLSDIVAVETVERLIDRTERERLMYVMDDIRNT